MVLWSNAGPEDTTQHSCMQTGSRGLELSPFQPKDELIRFAKEQAQSKAAAHQFLHAGRGTPNWVATTPRAAFFRLGEFALAESQRVSNEPDSGGMPWRAGIADRFRAFLERAGADPGVNLLRRGLEYGTRTLGLDADAFVHELADAATGDHYPGLSPAQQAQMTLFSLLALLDRADADERRCRAIVRDRLDKLWRGPSLARPNERREVGRDSKSIKAAAVDERHATRNRV